MTRQTEVTRTNVTLPVFFAAVKKACIKNGMECNIDIDFFQNPTRPSDDSYYVKNGIRYARYGKGEPTREYDGADSAAEAETSRMYPYDYQTYILNWDGSAFNEMCEFTFNDEKRGNGYYYQLNKDAEEKIMQNTITTFLAQPIGDQQVTPFEIKATETIPEIQTPGEAGLDEARQIYAGQAKMIADTLFGSLPGGTIDALLIEMLDRKRSLFCVPFGNPPAPPVEPTALKGVNANLLSAALLVLGSFAYAPGHGPAWYEETRAAVANQMGGNACTI